jgi:hypothetical protein
LGAWLHERIPAPIDSWGETDQLAKIALIEAEITRAMTLLPRVGRAAQRLLITGDIVGVTTFTIDRPATRPHPLKKTSQPRFLKGADHAKRGRPR